MKASKAFLAVSVGMLLLASSVSLGSPMFYTLDDGNAEDFPNQVNTSIWCGGGGRDVASINIFKTDAANNVITQLSVAWANLPADTVARVVLYAIENGYPAGGNSYGVPQWLTPLQVISTTVTGAQANPLTADPSVVYTIGSDPPVGKKGLQTKGVVDNPVWTTYNITPTAITTDHFAVAVINTSAEYTYGPALVDLDTDISSVTDPKISWLAVGPTDGVLSTDLSNIFVGAAFCTLSDVTEWGVRNTPFLIRAGVPEPATMSLLALGGLAAMLRRRRNK